MKKPLVFADLIQRAHSNTLDWQSFHPGVVIARLYKDEDGHTAALLRYEPGASVPHHVIFPPFFGQRFKVILTARNTMVMLRWCQPEGDTQVVLGSSAVLAA